MCLILTVSTRTRDIAVNTALIDGVESDRCRPCVDPLTSVRKPIWPTRVHLSTPTRSTSAATGSSHAAAATTTSRRATEETIAQAPDADLDDVDAAIGAARQAFDAGPWATATPDERARCLDPAGQCADGARRRLLRTVPGRVGLHRQRAADPGRRPRIHGAARGRTRRAADRRADRRVRGGGNHAASPRAARRRVDPHAVELPAQPQRDEGEPRAGRRQYRRAQTVTADAARRPRARANHRPAHRHSAGRGQRRHPERRRRQQAAHHRPANRHGQLHRKLSRRQAGDGRGGRQR